MCSFFSDHGDSLLIQDSEGRYLLVNGGNAGLFSNSLGRHLPCRKQSQDQLEWANIRALFPAGWDFNSLEMLGMTRSGGISLPCCWRTAATHL